MPGIGGEVEDNRRLDALDEIRQLYEYNSWANDRVLEAAAGLSPGQLTRDLGSSFPSVQATLAHMLAAEWIWLERWGGTSPTDVPDSWDVSTLESLRDQWRAVERDRMEFLGGLDDEAIHRTVAYRNTQGEQFANPLWQLLRHVVNHSTYHRGQVVTMLRQLGATPPATDLVLFHRERAAAGSQSR